MQIYALLLGRRLTRFLATSLLLFIICPACKKIDSGGKKIVPDQKEKFFLLPPNASPLLQRIAAKLKVQNDADGFLNNFIKEEGFIIWKNAEVITQKNHSAINARDVGETDTIVLLPTMPEEIQIVTSFLACKINTYIDFKLYRGSEYADNGFDKTNDRSKPNANDVVEKIMKFESLLFYNKIYKITDNRLFDFRPVTNLKPDVFFAKMVEVGSEECITWMETTSDDGGGSWADTGYTWTEGDCGGENGGGGTITPPWMGEPNPNLPPWYIPVGTGGIGGDNNTAINTCRGWYKLPFDGNTYDARAPDPCNNAVLLIGSQAAESEHIITNDPNITWWNNPEPNITYPPQQIPRWDDINNNFPKLTDGTDMCAQELYNLIGGQILNMYNSNPEKYNNGCALRLSRALIYSGIAIPYIADQTYRGSDGKYYFLAAAKLYNWMKKTFKDPPNTQVNLTKTQGGANGENFPNLLEGKKGIYIMQPSYPGNNYFGASGHCSIWNGNSCIHNKCDPSEPEHDGTYFDALGGVEKICLWVLN